MNEHRNNNQDALEEQSVLQHLSELRTRLLVSIIGWLVCSAVAYGFVGEVMQFLAKPLAVAFDDPENKRLIFTGLPEAFMTYIKLSLFTGLFVAFPIIAAQLYRFIAPGLYNSEKTAVLPFVVMSPLLFYAGAALAYYYIFPMAWKFFIAFELPHSGTYGLAVELEARISEYLKLVCSVVLAFGLAFQLPLALVLLVRAGMVSVERLAAGRKYAVVMLLICAAVLTPPDVVSQIGLFGALYALYEIAIIAGRMVEKRRIE